MSEKTFKKLNALSEICLNIAHLIDEQGERDEYDPDNVFKIGYGYRAASAVIREGIKAIIDMQEFYHEAKAQMDYARIGEKEMSDFLERVFGDPDVYCTAEGGIKNLKTYIANIDPRYSDEVELSERELRVDATLYFTADENETDESAKERFFNLLKACNIEYNQNDCKIEVEKDERK